MQICRNSKAMKNRKIVKEDKDDVVQDAFWVKLSEMYDTTIFFCVVSEKVRRKDIFGPFSNSVTSKTTIVWGFQYTRCAQYRRYKI